MRHGRLASLLEEAPEEERVRWDFFDLANQLGEVLQKAEDALRLEQAVYGLDSLDEVRLHQLIVRGMSRWWTVQRDVALPTKRKTAKGPRCELVFTPLGRHLKMTEEWELFSDVSGADSVGVEAALWMAVRVVRQFGDRGATGVDAVKKLAAEPRLKEAGVAAVVFSEGEEELVRELDGIEAEMAAKDIALIEGRHVRSVNITERLGHRLASVALWRVKGS